MVIRPPRWKLHWPRLSILGGAAVLLSFGVVLSIAALATAEELLPYPSWLSAYDYSVAKKATWDETARSIETAFPEPRTVLDWRYGGFEADRDGSLLSGAFKLNDRSWVEAPKPFVEGQFLCTGKLSLGKKPGVVFLRALVNCQEQSAWKLFYSADYFLAVYVNRQPVLRAYFEGPARAEAADIGITLAAGRNEIIAVVGRRPDCGTAYLRLGKANLFRKRFATLVALQNLFPEDRANVLDAQRQIVSLCLDGLDDADAAKAELRRLLDMAGVDATARSWALERLGEVYAKEGLYDVAVSMLRERLAIADEATEPGLDGRANAAVALSEYAGDSGYLATALCALGPAGGSAAVRLALVKAFSSYSLADRARQALGELQKMDLDERTRDMAAIEAKTIDSLRPNPAFIELNQSAAAKLEAARDFAARGAFDRAAGALLEALDGKGPPVVPAPLGAKGLSECAREILLEYPALAAEYFTSAKDVAPALTHDAAERRPLTDGARGALREFAFEAAAKGRYELAALAGGRLLEDYPPDADVAALAATSLAHAGRAAEARRIAEAFHGELAGAGAGDGRTLAEFVSDAVAASESATDPGDYHIEIGPSANLAVVWRQDVRVRGIHADAGALVHRPQGTCVCASGAVRDGRLYVFDGAQMSGYNLDTGERVFDNAPVVPPGCRLLTGRDLAGIVTIVPPAGVSAGRGAVYSTAYVWDTALRRTASIVAAGDSGTGALQWATRSFAVGEDMLFSSAPAYAHDRVYVVSRKYIRGSEPQESRLVCLDARDGTPVFSTKIDACYMPLSTAQSWGTVPFDPARFAAPPSVAGDCVYVTPNSGVVACVDALTGAVKSVQAYERSVLSTPKTGLVRLLASRPLRPLGAERSFCAAAPNDSAEAFVMRRGPGAVRLELPGAREIIGTSGDTVVAVLDTLCGIDAGTGKIIWKSRVPLDGLLSGGVAEGSYAYVPTNEALHVFSLQDGGLAVRCDWPDGTPRGNLIVTQAGIIGFGESDVALLAFSKSNAVRDNRGKKVATPRPGCDSQPARRFSLAPGVRGLWAAPSASDSLLLMAAAGVVPVIRAEGGRTLALLPGRPAYLWDITNEPKLLWAADLPSDLDGALFDGGRVIVWDAWSVYALDAVDGSRVWGSDLHTGFGQVEAASPVSPVIAEAGRVVCLRGNSVIIMNAENGEPVRRHEVTGTPVAWANSGAYFAVMTATWNGPNLVRFYDLRDGALSRILPVGSNYDWSASLVITDDQRAIAVCPNASLALCVDVPSGKVAWQAEKLPRFDRVLERKCSGDALLITGTQGNSSRVVALDVATGKTLFTCSCAGAAGLAERAVYALDKDASIVKYERTLQPVFKVPARFDFATQRPLAWLESADDVYVLVFDSEGGSKRPLAVASYDRASGEKRGQWELPLRYDARRQAEFAALENVCIIVATADGLLKARLQPGRAEAVPAYRASGGFEGLAGVGALTTGTAIAKAVGFVVVDGDLADWAEAVWCAVEKDGKRAAQVAFAHDGAALMIAVRTYGGVKPAGLPPGSVHYLRLSIDSRSQAAAAASVTLDILAAATLDVLPAAAKDSVSFYKTANEQGGFDYEILVPWRQLGGPFDEATGVPLVEAAISGGDGAQYWHWPQDFLYLPEYFGSVKLTAQAGGG